MNKEKPIAAVNETTGITDKTKIPLSRVFGPGTGILMVAGLMIGSGVFKKIAPMAATGLDETEILLAWISAGIFTMFGAFTIAGMATITSESGGVYEYLRMSTGNFFSFLFGWTVFTIMGSGSIAALAFVFAQSLNTLIQIPDPLYALKDVSLGNFITPFASSGVKIVAIASVAVLTWVNYRGTKNGGLVNNIVTSAKILGILLLIILGIFHQQSADASHIENLPVNNSFSNTAVFTAFFGAMLSSLWAYDGWAYMSSVTGEIKNPTRNVPIAIISGVGIAMFLYVSLNYAFMQVLPLTELAAIDENHIAAAAVAGAVMGKAGTVVISVLIMTCTFGALNACIIVYPRIYYRMAQEGFFFKSVANVHPKFRTPYMALIYSMAWSIILTISGTFDMLTNLVVFSGFLFWILMSAGLIKLKRKGVITSKVIGYPILQILFLLFSLVLIVNTAIVQPLQSSIGLLLLLSGVPFYLYFIKKSKQ